MTARRKAKYGEAEAAFNALIRLETDECVLWPFGTISTGYGSMHGTLAHIRSCEIAHGPRPTGQRYEAAHYCGNRLCINPRHLRWATSAENNGDKRRHGTLLAGERSPVAKLTAAQVRAIRADPRTSTLVAPEYGISAGHVCALRAGRSWRAEMEVAS